MFLELDTICRVYNLQSASLKDVGEDNNKQIFTTL